MGSLSLVTLTLTQIERKRSWWGAAGVSLGAATGTAPYIDPCGQQVSVTEASVCMYKSVCACILSMCSG